MMHIIAPPDPLLPFNADPDPAEVRGRMVASVEELPNGSILPDRWNSPVRRLRPRFVLAGVIAAVASFGIASVGLLAMMSDLPGWYISGLGVISVATTLAVLFATWPAQRVSSLSRIALGGVMVGTLMAAGSTLGLFG